MWELDHKEGWILKNSCFWTVLEKTLESPLDCKEIKPVNPKGNQPWIFIGRTDPEGEKLQYSGHLMWWANSEKTLMLRKIEGRRSRGQQRTRWLDSITDSVDMSKLREILVDRGAWRAAVHGAAKKQRRLSDWTTNNLIFRIPHKREQEVWSGCIHGKGLRQPQNPHWAGWWRFFSLHSVLFRSFSCVWFFWTQWTVSCQALPSMGFFRQEYWSGLPFLSPGDLPDPRIEPASLHLLHWQVGSLSLAPRGKPFPSQSQEVKTGGSDFFKWEDSNARF